MERVGITIIDTEKDNISWPVQAIENTELNSQEDREFDPAHIKIIEDLINPIKPATNKARDSDSDEPQPTKGYAAQDYLYDFNRREHKVPIKTLVGSKNIYLQGVYGQNSYSLDFFHLSGMAQQNLTFNYYALIMRHLIGEFMKSVSEDREGTLLFKNNWVPREKFRLAGFGVTERQPSISVYEALRRLYEELERIVEGKDPGPPIPQTESFTTQPRKEDHYVIIADRRPGDPAHPGSFHAVRFPLKFDFDEKWVMDVTVCADLGQSVILSSEGEVLRKDVHFIDWRDYTPILKFYFDSPYDRPDFWGGSRVMSGAIPVFSPR